MAPTLHIPTAPIFPLSSPITEEIPSPVSSSSEERDRPLEVKTSCQTTFVHTSERAAHRSQMVVADPGSSHAQTAGDLSANNAKTKPERPVGLNLVTDFSLSVPKPKKRSPTFVDLNDLKSLCRSRERERSVQKIKGILRKRSQRAHRRAPDESLHPGTRASILDVQEETPSKKRRDGLSPSDRPIPIGFTISHPESESEKDISKVDDVENQLTPLTPSIIVTPAREDSFWEDIYLDCPRPRVASSVYSQPTPCLNPSEVPPVPAIPACHSTEKIATPTATPSLHQRRLRKSRSYSTVTVFEDDSPDSGGSRTLSNGNDKEGLDRLSINTETNRHQSQGWWTYLLSPLLKRSSTTTSKTPTSPDRPPLLPNAAGSTASSEDWWEKEEVSCFSPETPETTGEPSAWKNNTNPFTDANLSRSEPENTAGDIFAGQAIQGCAAEYYQASAHELFSGTSYFECLNHVCSITPDKPLVHKTSQRHKANPMSGTRGLALVEVDSHTAVQSPQSVGNAPSRHRFSGSTAINDRNEPFDVKGLTSPNGNTKRPSPLEVKRKTLDKSNHLAQPPRPSTPVTPFYIPPASAPAPAESTNPATVERAIPHCIVIPQSHQPDPISPAFQQAAERSGIPLSNIHITPPYTTADENVRASLPQRPTPVLGGGRITSPGPRAERERSETRQKHEKEEKSNKKSRGCGKGLWKNRGCFGSGKSGKEGQTKRRWYFVIAALFLLILLIAILLAVFLAPKHGGGASGGSDDSSDDSGSNKTPGSGNVDDTTTPTESRWLNLTGYPPMPTGISTIVGPETRVEESGCIHPGTLWSCALPKEEQSDNKPYDANQPNFRVQIRFRNGTYPRSTTVASRDTSWDASPSVPDDKDQQFLGNTTDHNTAPVAGEETPFYITFLSPEQNSSTSSSGVTRRSDSSSFPNLKDIIPSPDVESDGTPAAANLYPLPESQPIRLYNRGKETEHYGFYTYFDRSIFLESSAPLNGSAVDFILSDRHGGSSKEDARARCTWSQTRFLVQIWTQADKSGKTLLQPSASSSSTTTSNSNSTYTRPGTLPYPITITLDRHGGAAKKKMVYCYGIDDDHTLNSTAVKLQIEDRAYKGDLVNPAPGVFNNTDVVGDGDGQDGGIDGGDGGCGCQWVNWVSLV